MNERKTGKTERMTVMCPGCAKALTVIVDEYLAENRGIYVSSFKAPHTFLCGCSMLLHLELVETCGGDRHLVVTRTEKADMTGVLVPVAIIFLPNGLAAVYDQLGGQMAKYQVGGHDDVIAALAGDGYEWEKLKVSGSPLKPLEYHDAAGQPIAQ